MLSLILTKKHMQFLISGGDKRNKGDYFASLIAKALPHSISSTFPFYSFLPFFTWMSCFDLQHQAEAFGLHSLHGTTYFPRNPEMHSKRYPHEDYDFVTPG